MLGITPYKLALTAIAALPAVVLLALCLLLSPGEGRPVRQAAIHAEVRR
jgi:hypothetical protein